MEELLAALGLKYWPESAGQENSNDQKSPFEKELMKIPKGKRDDLLSQIIKNLELNLDYTKFQEPYVSGSRYGGRIGYGASTENGNRFRAGITGGGADVNTPIGRIKESMLTGGDVGYTFGPNDVSLAYITRGGVPLARIPSVTESPQLRQSEPINDNFLGMPVKDFWQLLYRRQF